MCGVYAYAQQNPKVIAEITSGREKLVKNAPFSCEAVSESVQTLADGNRIVRSSTSKLYRNSEGRFRREMATSSGDGHGFSFSFGQGISIFDPVAGQRFLLDSQMRTARVLELRALEGKIASTAVGKLDPEKRKETEAKLAELKARGETMPIPALPPMPSIAVTVPPMPPGAIAPMPFVFGTGQNKFDSKTEELGQRDFEGVSADGTRTVTTIPAGAIGNERPIEITYERWYSKDLEMVVYSKHSDPRFGDQTYRLTNIVRAEPDPSLFTLPAGYKIVTTPGAAYTITTPKKATAAKPATTVTVSNQSKP